MGRGPGPGTRPGVTDELVDHLAEEVGIAADLVVLGDVRYEDDRVRELARVYRAESSGPFSFPDGEVVDSAWVDLAELAGWVAGREVCPDSVVVVLPLLGT